jgi:hypothetical protein
MHFLGALRLGAFLLTWIWGAISVPLALILCYFKFYWMFYIIITYYCMRFIFPVQFWLRWKTIMRMNEYPYCNSQNVVFEKGAKAPNKCSKTMLAVSPHGILTIGYVFLVSSIETEASMFKWLVAESLLVLPFVRDVMIWTDIHGCSKKNLTSFMSKGENVSLIPGGFQEATLFQRGKNNIFIKERKGFIKYALRYGYTLQLAYVFGEEQTFWQMPPTFLSSVRFWLNKYNIPATIFSGRYFWLMPDNDIDITIVIGKGFKCPQIDNPSVEDVNKYHAKYIEEMTDLFERNKDKYGSPNSDKKLEIF